MAPEINSGAISKEVDIDTTRILLVVKRAVGVTEI